MPDYKKIVNNILKKSVIGKLNENVVYPEGLAERMHPKLEEELMSGNHSLGKHPIFPDNDESTFEEKIMGERFNEVTKRYKRAFDVDEIDDNKLKRNMMPLVYKTMEMEKKHKKELERIAEEMIREEFNMDKDIVEIRAELTPVINMIGTKKNPKPIATETEFKNHDELTGAKKEVYKRRFINAMIQGAAKKCNHMFHLVDDELTDLDPRLPNNYSKMMAAADYMYYIIPEMDNGVNGGVVRVQFPTKSNPKAIIYAQAMVFPVLIHELVKGVMELISGHGLPKNKKIGEYVINKADFLAAEPWDMRLGPGIWGRFTNLIDADDFNLKHQIYTELISLPVDEFNIKMREIMAGTKEGKKIIKDIVDEIKKELNEDEFNSAMNEIGDKNIDLNSNETTYGFDDIFGDGKDDGFDYDELF